jgi:GH15 family glucan-1,4-alpha-glucosidase
VDFPVSRHVDKPWGNELIEALAEAGRSAEAKSLMDKVHAVFSPLGLLSEDYETSTLRMWGNFPQAYSHVGLIHAAFAASPHRGGTRPH